MYIGALLFLSCWLRAYTSPFQHNEADVSARSEAVIAALQRENNKVSSENSFVRL